jgi:hypothetical protein
VASGSTAAIAASAATADAARWSIRSPPAARRNPNAASAETSSGASHATDSVRRSGAGLESAEIATTEEGSQATASDAAASVSTDRYPQSSRGAFPVGRHVTV